MNLNINHTHHMPDIHTFLNIELLSDFKRKFMHIHVCMCVCVCVCPHVCTCIIFVCVEKYQTKKNRLKINGKRKFVFKQFFPFDLGLRMFVFQNHMVCTKQYLQFGKNIEI